MMMLDIRTPNALPELLCGVIFWRIHLLSANEIDLTIESNVSRRPTRTSLADTEIDPITMPRCPKERKQPRANRLLPPERAALGEPGLATGGLAQDGRAALADDDGLGVGEDGGDGEAAGALDVHEEGAGRRHKGLSRKRVSAPSTASGPVYHILVVVVVVVEVEVEVEVEVCRCVCVCVP